MEALFYLSFPLILSLTSRVRIQFILIGSIFCVILGEFLRGVMLGYYPNSADFFPVFHLPQFILGVALGRFFLESTIPLPLGIKTFVVSLLIINLALFFFSDERRYWILPIVACSFGVVILSAANLSGVALIILQGPLPVLLGEASYGFYITHMPIMIGFHKLACFLGLHHDNWGIPVLLSGFLFCTLFSIIIHLMIEKPTRAWILSRCRTTIS